MSKKRSFAFCFALTVLSLGPVARAQEEDPGRAVPTTAAPRAAGGAIEFGLRTGYGIPLGHTGRAAGDTSDDALSSSIKGEIPLWLDFGYRFDPRMYLGLSFQYAFGLVPSNQCSSGVSCSVSDMRLGANFMYHVTPEQPADLWLGFGVGYEWLRLSVSDGNVSGDATGSGFEFANFQAGVDFAVAPAFALGPFVSFSLGEYRSLSLSAPGASADEDIVSKSLHEWLVLGVRGSFDVHL